MHLLKINTIANNTREISIRLLINIHHVSREFSFALSFISLTNDRRFKSGNFRKRKRMTYSPLVDVSASCFTYGNFANTSNDTFVILTKQSSGNERERDFTAVIMRSHKHVTRREAAHTPVAAAGPCVTTYVRYVLMAYHYDHAAA